MKKFLLGFLVLVFVGAVVFVSGPRIPVDLNVTFDSSKIGADPQAYLAGVEANVPGIQDNLEKEIIWAYPASQAKTPLSIVYIHGFSAAKEEIRPLPDKVAEALNANLYYARLTGHGRDGDALAEATVNDWINDFAEAMAIGRIIGGKVIVLSTSTGGGLATVAAVNPDLSKDLAAFVFVSPNYAVHASGSEILTLPWGQKLAELVAGEQYSFTPQNDRHGKYWTTSYPTRALLPMAALTKLARETAVEKIKIPALFVFSESDTVVKAEVTRDIASRWGGPSQVHLVENAEDPNNHVIAGDVLSPANSEPLAQIVLNWIKKTLPETVKK